MTRHGVEEQSLEALASRIEARERREEEDPQRAMDDLIRDLADTRGGDQMRWGAVRGDEVTCASCHLVVHRTRVRDEERGICIDCSLRAAA